MFFLVIAQVEHATSLKASLVPHVWMVGSVINKESPVLSTVQSSSSCPVPFRPCHAQHCRQMRRMTLPGTGINKTTTHMLQISLPVLSVALSALLLPTTIRCIYSSSTHPQHILHTFTVFMLSRFTIIIDPSPISLSLWSLLPAYMRLNPSPILMTPFHSGAAAAQFIYRVLIPISV